jgi:hypothetical protein
VLGDYMALLNLGKRYVATGNSDSHRILYGWAGYPRTFTRLAQVAPQASDGPAVARTWTPLDVVRALKAGHAVVSSGPLVEWSIGDAAAGDTLAARSIGETLRGHLRVLAAPWIDVHTVQIIVNGRVVATRELPARELRTGPEPGSRADVLQRMVRIEEDVDVPTLPSDTWTMVVARGTVKLDAFLPSTPYLPMAFSNPIWIDRKH